MASRSPLTLAVHRLVLRMRRPRLRRLVEFGYAGAARVAYRYLTGGRRDAGCYVRGGLGTEDFVPGVSDVDLAVVFAEGSTVPSRAAERARARWQRLRAAVPVIEMIVDWPRIYDEAELRELAGASAFTYGLDDPAGASSGYFGARATTDSIRMLERPGLYGSTADWRFLAGSDRRPAEPSRDAQDRRIAAWLELVFWWRVICRFCVDPTLPGTAHMGVKLVSEPARIWLWLAHGERAASRADALRRVLAYMPEEEAALRRALVLLRALPDAPEPPLAELLPACVRLSSRIAGLIAAEVVEASGTEVRLAGGPAELIGASDHALPLADWRSIACAEVPDESFVLLAGNPGHPAALAAAAGSHATGTYAALRADHLLVLPGVAYERTQLRAVKCPVTDPVPFALAEGGEIATFPDVRGWSAMDTARRAVAEHRTWLREGSAYREGPELGRLLTAARAGLFLQSIADDDPELCVTATATAQRLSTRVADEALEAYRAFDLRQVEPHAGTVAALRRVVEALPSYRCRRHLLERYSVVRSKPPA